MSQNHVPFSHPWGPDPSALSPPAHRWAAGFTGEGQSLASDCSLGLEVSTPGKLRRKGLPRNSQISLHRKPPQLTHLPPRSELSCCSSPPPQSPRPLSTLLPPTALHKYLHSSSGASETPHTGAGGTLPILSRPRASEGTAPLYLHGQEAFSSPGQPTTGKLGEKCLAETERQTDSWRKALPEATTCPRLQTIPDPDQKNRDICAPRREHTFNFSKASLVYLARIRVRVSGG